MGLDFDPWYFQTDTDIRFLTPDKFQHFWGSYALSKKVGPLAALTAALLWEVWEKQNGQFISKRDIAADCLGIIASKIRGPTMGCVYNKEHKEIMLVISMQI